MYFCIFSPPYSSNICICLNGFNRVCCSCCACKSISTEAVSLSFETVTVLPFIRFTTFPVGLSLLEINTSSSASSISSSLSFLLTVSLSTVKRSSTSPSEFSFLNSSLGNFPPRHIPREPIIIDFPAPVSPVRIFKPLSKSISISSIRSITCFSDLKASPSFPSLMYFFMSSTPSSPNCPS